MTPNHTRMYWLHTLSPTHVGTGRGLGYIDLPIHRDAVTNWPAIPASSFKGVWADHFRATDKKRREEKALGLAFGRASDKEKQASNAGALVPTDARLVCLPVRSFFGTFAWCTSPMALRWLARDLEQAGEEVPAKLPDKLKDNFIHIASPSVLKSSSDAQIYLEDLDFPSESSALAQAWAEKLAEWVFPDDPQWQASFCERFAIVPDAIFDHFCETGTEVTTRVRIDNETKTVAQRQLWTEEALPAESILAGFVTCDRMYEKKRTQADDSLPAGEQWTPESLLKKFANPQGPLSLQIGGKATVGRGRIRCIFSSTSGDKE